MASLGTFINTIFPGAGGFGAAKRIGQAVAPVAQASTQLVGTPLPSLVAVTPDSLVGKTAAVAGAALLAPPALSGAATAGAAFLSGTRRQAGSSSSQNNYYFQQQPRAAQPLRPTTMGLFDDGIDFGDLGDFSDAWSQVSGIANTFSDVWSSQGGGDVVLDPVQLPVPVTQTGAGAVMAAGGVWLGSVLARTFGGAARGAVMTAANGVKVRLSQLWPLVRKYGPQAVQAALGISAGALGALLMEPAALQGRSGRRGRGRSISARDVKTTRRTLKAIRKLYNMMPTRPSSGRGHYHTYRRYYRGRR